jgi:RNA polymerase sigma factor (sigma-70 family)
MENARSSPDLGSQLTTLYTLGAAGTLTDGQLLERFLARMDLAASEAAFTALVDRHGAMVLSVCRQLLSDPHDAEDAFQATFLILVSKAGSIRHREAVGGWLFGIARRVAARAQVEAARRRRHLRVLAENPPGARADIELGTAPLAETDYGPLIAAIDRLPEQLRSPVVLHYFEGLSTEVAAQRLGCPRGTVLSRLSRARSRIKERLEQQGVSFTALIPAGETLTRWIPPVPVPAGLAQTTVQAAASLALAGAAIESIVPARVAALSRGVTRTLVITKVRLTAALLLMAVAGVSIGLAATYTPTDEPQGAALVPSTANPSRDTIAKDQAVPAEDKARRARLVFRGLVLDPDGKPVVGAQLLLGLPSAGNGVFPAPQPLGTSGMDGRFEISTAHESIEPAAGHVFMPAVIAAIVPGFGPDWAAIAPKPADAEITLRLRRDDVPIEGRVISLEGRPVPDLAVTVASIAEFPPKLLEKLRENAGKINPELWGEMRDALIVGKNGPIPGVQTGPDGRFRLTRIGRDRVALLIVEGPAIEQSFAMVLTAADPAYQPLLLPGSGSDERRLERSRFDLNVAPGRIIEGVVIDLNTRKPIAGARAHAWVVGSTTTDSQGKFRIGGQPKGRENFLTVEVDGHPYIKVVKEVPNPAGVGPIAVEITLKRARWVDGKVKNRADGSPVKAVVQYYPSRDNPHVQECTDASFLNNNVSDEPEFPTDAEGRFRAVALPGPGFLTVKAAEPGFVSAPQVAPEVTGKVLSAGDFQYDMPQYQALVPIDVSPDGSLTVPDIGLAPGRPQHLQMIDADGRPVAGTKIASSQRQPFDGESVPGSDYTFVHKHAGKPETLVILQADRALGAALELKGDEPDPIRVVLHPTGRITSRLVDEEGRPRSNVELELSHDLKSHGSSSFAGRSDPIFTGPDGRFQIRNLVPGVQYNVSAIKKNERNFSLRGEGYLHKNWWTIKPGETVDWGDVQVQIYRR